MPAQSTGRNTISINSQAEAEWTTPSQLRTETEIRLAALRAARAALKSMMRPNMRPMALGGLVDVLPTKEREDALTSVVPQVSMVALGGWDFAVIAWRFDELAG